MKLDGYTLTERMRKTRRRLPLTSTEQALYHELVAICNEDGWADVFPCSNDELCAALRLSENTLDKARLTLIQAGLVFYKSGKSKRQFGQYSFVKSFEKEKTVSASTAKFETNTGTNQGTNTGTNRGTNQGTNAADYIEGQTKTETKPNKTSSSGDGAPVEKKKDGTPHWEKLVDTWFVFYGDHFKDDGGQPAKPIFDAAKGKHLKKIATNLKKLADSKQREWSEDYATYCLRGFLQKAVSDTWLKEHFELENLSLKFNSIVNKNAKSTTNIGNSGRDPKRP